MNRSLFLIVFVLLVSTKFHAQEIQFLSFNDSWGGGFNSIYDDYRTYGFGLNYLNGNKYKIETEFSALTHRYAQQPEHRETVDELKILYSQPILKKSPHLAIDLFSGVYFSGAILGKEIQDFTHSTFGVEKTNLPYAQQNGIYFSVGYDVNRQIYSNGSFELNFNHTLEQIFRYKSKILIGVPLSYKTQSGNITLSTNYIFAENLLKNLPVLDAIVKSESGLNFNLKVEGQRFFYFFNTYPNQNFSTGGLGIRFLNKKSKGNNAKLTIETSVLSNSLGYNFKYGFTNFKFFDRKSNLIINHNFHTYLRKSIPQFPDVNGHGLALSFGLETKLLKRDFKYFEPFSNISVGDKIIGIYSKTLNIEKQSTHHLFVSNDIGTKICIPIILNGFKRQLNFSIYHRLMFLFANNNSKSNVLVNPKNNPFKKTQSAIGLGIAIQI